MPRSDYAFVERLLYQQKTHDSVIAELQAELDELISIPSASFVVIGDKTSSALTSTENSVNRRLFSIKGKYLQEEIKRRKRHKKAIDEALRALNDIERKLVWFHYHLEKPARECARRMGYSLSRWYELKHQVVVKVARFLGLTDEISP